MTHVHSGTLTASTVTTVSLDEPYENIVVYNRSASTDEIWIRNDGTNPTVAGDDCYLVPAGKSVSIPAITSIAQKADGSIPGSTVKLISSGTPSFTVEGF